MNNVPTHTPATVNNGNRTPGVDDERSSRRTFLRATGGVAVGAAEIVREGAPAELFGDEYIHDVYLGGLVDRLRATRPG